MRSPTIGQTCRRIIGGNGVGRLDSTPHTGLLFRTEDRCQAEGEGAIHRSTPPGAPSCLRTEADFRSTDYFIATGADPVRLDVPGAGLSSVHYLRSLDDSRAIIAKAANAKKVVVIGASFIGLEAAAALRHRNIEVHVVGPQARPLEQILGPSSVTWSRPSTKSMALSSIRNFCVGDRRGSSRSGERRTAHSRSRRRGHWSKAERGACVECRDHRRQRHCRRRIPANECPRNLLPSETSPVGPIGTAAARSIKHGSLLERQGQTAAINILGGRQRFDAVPFFWSQHYDVTVSYVGHAEKWDKLEINGDPTKYDCKVTYLSAGKKLAVATASRDLESLRAEVELEQS